MTHTPWAGTKRICTYITTKILYFRFMCHIHIELMKVNSDIKDGIERNE